MERVFDEINITQISSYLQYSMFSQSTDNVKKANIGILYHFKSIPTSSDGSKQNFNGFFLAIRKYLSLELGTPNCKGVNRNS